MKLYLSNNQKDFLLNVQFGFGYEWRINSNFSLGQEFILNRFINDHKVGLLSEKMMIGT